MGNLTLQLEIETEGSMHIGSGNGFSAIIDEQSMSYMEEKHRWPIILGHTMKGLVREEFRNVSKVCNYQEEREIELFGNEKNQGILYFSHCSIHDDLKKMLKQTNTAKKLFTTKAGNQINRLTKVAQNNRLFSHEVVKDHILWTGKIEGSLSSDTEIKYKKNNYPITLIHLLLALKAVKRVGSRKSVGMGSCEIRITSMKWNNVVLNEVEILNLIDQGIPALTAGGIR